MQYPKPGFGSTAEYQVSGLPYAITGSVGPVDATKVEFPFITKFIQVRNSGTNYLKVGFTDSGTKGGNRFLLGPSGSFVGDLRIKDLFIMSNQPNASASFELIAGLTMIDRTMMPTLSMSGAPGIVAANTDSTMFGYLGLGY